MLSNETFLRTVDGWGDVWTPTLQGADGTELVKILQQTGFFLATLDLLESLGQAGPGPSQYLSSAEAANMLPIFLLKPSAGLITLAMFTYFRI